MLYPSLAFIGLILLGCIGQALCDIKNAINNLTFEVSSLNGSLRNMDINLSGEIRMQSKETHH